MPRRNQGSATMVTALDRIRGRAASIRPSVRRLAAYANVHSCPTAAVAFAARVDTNRALIGTALEMPFGQSPFAIGRGVAFEAFLRRHGHAELRRVLSEGLEVDFSMAAIENLRRVINRIRWGLSCERQSHGHAWPKSSRVLPRSPSSSMARSFVPT
jgi:hypothetical protein